MTQYKTPYVSFYRRVQAIYRLRAVTAERLGLPPRRTGVTAQEVARHQETTRINARRVLEKCVDLGLAQREEVPISRGRGYTVYYWLTTDDPPMLAAGEVDHASE